MTSLLLIVGGVLFLLEATMGLFTPRVYEFLEPASRARRPYLLPLIGAALASCGVVLLVLNIPPARAAHWVLAVLGAACVAKGLVMAFRPSLLRDTPRHVRENPRRWRLQCAWRAAAGAVLVTWGAIGLFTEGWNAPR